MDELENDALSLLLLMDDHLLPLFLEWCSQEGCADMIMFLLESDFLRYKSDLNFRSTQDKFNMHSSFHYLHTKSTTTSSHSNTKPPMKTKLQSLLLPSQHDSLYRLFKSKLPLHASYAQICDLVWQYLLTKSKTITSSTQWNSVRKYLIADSLEVSDSGSNAVNGEEDRDSFEASEEVQRKRSESSIHNTKVNLEDVISDMTYCRYFERFLQVQSNDLAALHCWLAVRRMLSRVSVLHDLNRPRRYSFEDPSTSTAHNTSSRTRSNTSDEVKPSFLARWRGVQFSTTSKSVMDSANSVLKRTTASMNIDTTSAQQHQQQQGAAEESAAATNSDHHYTNPFEAFKILLSGTRSLQRQFFPRGSLGSTASSSHSSMHGLPPQNCSGLPESLRMEIAATLALNSTVRTEDIEVVAMSFAITCANILEKLLRNLEHELHHFLQSKYNHGFIQSNDYAVMIAYMKCHQSTSIMQYQQKVDFLYSAIRIEHVLHWADQRCAGQLFLVYDPRSIVKKCWLGDISEEEFVKFQCQQKAKRSQSFRWKQAHSQPKRAPSHAKLVTHPTSASIASTTSSGSSMEAVQQLPMILACRMDLCIPSDVQFSVESLAEMPHAIRMWAVADALPDGNKTSLRCDHCESHTRTYLRHIEEMMHSLHEDLAKEEEGVDAASSKKPRGLGATSSLHMTSSAIHETIHEEDNEEHESEPSPQVKTRKNTRIEPNKEKEEEEAELVSNSSSDYEEDEEVQPLFIDDSNVIDDMALLTPEQLEALHSKTGSQSKSRHFFASSSSDSRSPRRHLHTHSTSTHGLDAHHHSIYNNGSSIYADFSSFSTSPGSHHADPHHTSTESLPIRITMTEIDQNKLHHQYYNQTSNLTGDAITPTIVGNVMTRLLFRLGLQEGDFEYRDDHSIMTIIKSKTLKLLMSALYGENFNMSSSLATATSGSSDEQDDQKRTAKEDEVEHVLFQVLISIKCCAIRANDNVVEAVSQVSMEEDHQHSFHTQAFSRAAPQTTDHTAAAANSTTPTRHPHVPSRTTNNKPFKSTAKITMVITPCGNQRYDRSMQQLSRDINYLIRRSDQHVHITAATAVVSPISPISAPPPQLHVYDAYASLWYDVLTSSFTEELIAKHPLFFTQDEESLYDVYLGSYPIPHPSKEQISTQHSVLQSNSQTFAKYAPQDIIRSWPISKTLGIVDFSMSALIYRLNIRHVVHMMMLLLTNHSILCVSHAHSLLYQVYKMLPRILYPYQVLTQTHDVTFLHSKQDVKDYFHLQSNLATTSPIGFNRNNLLKRAMSSPVHTIRQGLGSASLVSAVTSIDADQQHLHNTPTGGVGNTAMSPSDGIARSHSASTNSISMPILPTLSRSQSGTTNAITAAGGSALHHGNSIYNFNIRSIIQSTTATTMSSESKAEAKDFESLPDDTSTKEGAEGQAKVFKSKLIFVDASSYHSVRQQYLNHQLDSTTSTTVQEQYQDMLVFDLDALTTSLLFAKADDHVEFSPYDLRNDTLFHGEQNPVMQHLITSTTEIHNTLLHDVEVLEREQQDGLCTNAKYHHRLTSLIFISNTAIEFAFHQFHTKLLLGSLPEHIQHYHESNTISCQMQHLLASLLAKHAYRQKHESATGKGGLSSPQNMFGNNATNSNGSVAEDELKKEDIIQMDFDSFLAFYNDQTAHSIGSLSHVFYADFLTGLAPAFVDLLKRHGMMLNDWRF